jgi:CxxC motif-containing protein (DUF1111 family)
MRCSYSLWYAVGAVLVFVPVGLRVLSWSGPNSADVDVRAAAAGKVLFTHEWTFKDPLCPIGDGLGPVFNATSCAACHKQGGLGGAGGVEHNVTTFVVESEPLGVNNNMVSPRREGVVHARAISAEFQETLRNIDSSFPEVSQPELKLLLPIQDCGILRTPLRAPENIHVSQRNTPALFGAKLIDQINERDIIALERQQRLRWNGVPGETETSPVGRAPRLAGGKIGKFGWKGQSASLSDFVVAACANELGLGNPSQAQPAPLGKPSYKPVGLDLTTEQCDQITAFVASLPRPSERPPTERRSRQHIEDGKQLFHSVGCAECHTPNIGSVEGLYSDLLLHRMGAELIGGGSYNQPSQPQVPSPEQPRPDEWRTPPLWGVADSAPYMHDGRAANLDEAIRLHRGQGQTANNNYQRLTEVERAQLVAFLRTLKAP